MNKIFFILFILPLVVGCDTYKVLKPSPPAPIIPNISNMTNTTTIQSLSNLSQNYHYYIDKESTIILFNSTLIVIDSAGYNVANLLSGKTKPNLFISTNNAYSKTFGLMVMTYKPDAVFDNGLPSGDRDSYLKYAEYMNITRRIVDDDWNIGYTDIDLNLIATYKEGFSNVTDSIVVKANDLLYMSNCYGECEKLIPNEWHPKIVVLANRGACPTTSLRFLLERNVKIVVGEVLCKDLEDIKYFNIIQYKSNYVNTVMEE